jgi:hypothetical protein
MVKDSYGAIFKFHAIRNTSFSLIPMDHGPGELAVLLFPCGKSAFGITPLWVISSTSPWTIKLGSE